MSVHFFVPAAPAGDGLEALLQAAVARPPLPPFDPALLAFVNDFSKSILLDREARAYPELIVMANFFRSANVARLARELDGGALARGLVFHIAPSNVDSVFLYSSLLSLLCGNINLIRISRESGPQIDFILAKLRQLLDGPHAALAERFYVATYPHDDAITSLISRYCHLRVVWGGDATVGKIRSLPLRPTAAEICFPDRFSAAMLQADAVLQLDAPALDRLCAGFFNDSIWFSQQACSSPRLVAWIGSDARCAEARRVFWQAFARQLAQQSFENTGGMAMDRLVAACLVAAGEQHQATETLAFPARLLLAPGPVGEARHHHCGNGLFFEQCYAAVPDFLRTLSDREQTLTVFGVAAPEMAQHLQHLPMRALDRVTRIGHALDFAHVWDGYNLLHVFTRRISLEL